jgi:hypothetical protein
MRLSGTTIDLGSILKTKPLYGVKKYPTSILFVKTNMTPLYDFEKEMAVVETRDGMTRFEDVFITSKEAWLKAVWFMKEFALKKLDDGRFLKDSFDINLIYQDLTINKFTEIKLNRWLGKAKTGVFKEEWWLDQIVDSIRDLDETKEWLIDDIGLGEKTDFSVIDDDMENNK